MDPSENGKLKWNEDAVKPIEYSKEVKQTIFKVPMSLFFAEIESKLSWLHCVDYQVKPSFSCSPLINAEFFWLLNLGWSLFE